MTSEATSAAKIDFVMRALQASGVNITDFSKLTQISRTTLHKWKRGQHASDQLRLNVAFNYAIRLDKAVESKKLPLQGTWAADERLEALRNVIAKTNREMRG